MRIMRSPIDSATDRPSDPVAAGTFDAVAEDDEGGSTEADEPSRDLVSALCSDVSQVPLLSRDEEERVAVLIAARRQRILVLLRSRRRLLTAALENVGRGLVHPDADFREREALRVLAFARRRLAGMGPQARGRKALSSFVGALDQELAAYRRLRDQMMTANIRLAMALARRYRHPTLSFLDLVQEGVLGLMRAVEKYEPNREIKFSTYAVWWIWQQISRAADYQGAMIRTPVHWNQFRRRLGRQWSLTELEVDADAVAVAHGLSPERAAVMAQSFQCLSLAAPLGDDDNNRTLADTLAADSSANPERSMLNYDLSQRLAVAVSGLPDREAQIIRLRFGLSGGRAYTLEEIGERFGVSRERVRQLEARALKRMRAICDQQRLYDFLP